MIARPLLERLEAVRGEVELVVLRPPTLEALERQLAAARRGGRAVSRCVHFDGHGALHGPAAAAGGASRGLRARGRGVLVFEKPDGRQ